MIAEKAAAPLRIGDVTVIPLMRVRLQGGRGGRGIWVRGSAGPAGLVVLSGKGAEFLDEPLVHLIPRMGSRCLENQLRDLLGRMRGDGGNQEGRVHSQSPRSLPSCGSSGRLLTVPDP